MMRSLASTCALLAAGAAAQGTANRPIIGVLSLPNDVPGYTQYSSYFAASYVKWLEMAGARVVPLVYTDPNALQQTLKYINGALFTGGGTAFSQGGNLTPFAAAAELVFQEAVNAFKNGETWPLWGTCLGHELISFLAANNNESVLTSGYDSENLTLPLTFTAAAPSSRMYANYPPDVYATLSTRAVTINMHQAAIAPADFAANPSLANRFTILSTNTDRGGRPFVSSMEGQGGLPIFSTQYHPEKVQFEWTTTECMDHGYASIMANHLLALNFVNQSRANGRQFPSPSQESAALIYNYNATYVAPSGSTFEQCYFFD